MRPGSALTLCFALALAVTVVAVPSALARSSAAQANSQTYTDSTGENANAPDITSVAVSNNDAGLITFKLNISNRPSLTDDMSFLISLDTDQRTSTGDPDAAGADYALQLVPGEADLFKWNGSDYVAAASQSSVTFSYDASGATIRASTADLGGTKGFNFAALAISGITFDSSGNADFSKAAGDAAPDTGHGTFAYQVLTKLTLSVVSLTTSPKPAKAGKSFTVSLAANENDTNGPVEAGTVACSATIGAKHLSASAHRVANGLASCVWTLPKGVKGTVKGTVSLTVKGTTLSRPFSSKVT